MSRATELLIIIVSIVGAWAVGWVSGVIPALLGALSFLIQAALVIAMLPIALVCIAAISHCWPKSSR